MAAAERMETDENGHAGVGRDGDTEEFSEGELAHFVEQSWSQSDKNGDRNLPWARLVSVGKGYSNIELVKSEVSLGRAEVVNANGEEDMHVSKAHCKIWTIAETGSCYLSNLSVNGTFVQGKLVEKEQELGLHHGDEISLGPRTSGCPLFVFQLLNKVQHGPQKRAIEVEADSGSDHSMDLSGNGPGPKRPKMMESLDTFKCSICLNVWHDVISVTPCLHSFCNSCFSDWYRKSCRDRSECKCPQCRGSVSSVSRNHTLRSLVEDLLKEDPSLGRSPEDVIELEKTALFKGAADAQLQFGRSRNTWLNVPGDDEVDGDWGGDDVVAVLSSDEDDEDNDTEADDYQCVQCALALGGLFQCAPGQSHHVCVSCRRLYPERTDLQNIAQTCQVCSKAYCRTYMESQHLAPDSDFHHCPKIVPLSQRTMIDMPNRTHHSNFYEQDVTRQYIAEQGLSVHAVVRDWLGRLDTGEADQPPLFRMRVNSVSPVCDLCTEEVFAHLLDKFRALVPRTELPPDAAGRPDCWYGYECRTQHHKDAHARKLNHVCEPSRPSNRRSTAVHM